eukprot:scaffold208304_cov89-Cyclotella_meneghiniana.AAC.1
MQPSQEEQHEVERQALQQQLQQQHTPQRDPIINGHETCLASASIKTYLYALINAKETYQLTIKENLRVARIGRVMGMQQKGTAKDKTTEGFENNEHMPPASFASLSDQKVKNKTNEFFSGYKCDMHLKPSLLSRVLQQMTSVSREFVKMLKYSS